VTDGHDIIPDVAKPGYRFNSSSRSRRTASLSGHRTMERGVSKSKKTSQQLETMIKAGVSQTMLWPKNAVVSIWPDADSWKAVCHSPNPVQDKERIERVRTESDRLKLEFDLDL
jgi:hypothetical protein